MTMTLQLTPEIEQILKRAAQVRGGSAEFFGLNLLTDALEAYGEPEETLEDVVARIQSTPPSANAIKNASTTPLYYDPDETLEELVARIQATPPNPDNIENATGDLAKALASVPEDPNFDEESWQQEWTEVEAEIEAMNKKAHQKLLTEFRFDAVPSLRVENWIK